MQDNSHDSARRGEPGSDRTTRREFLTILPAIMVLERSGLSVRVGGECRPSCTSRGPLERPVYVVDDCTELTVLYRLWLETAGFQVRSFTDRAEALRALLPANPPPALLVTDYDGYPISAEQLMAACRRAHPDLRILMASGYPEGCLTFAGVRPDRFLFKPFELDQFMAEVRALTRGAQTL